METELTPTKHRAERYFIVRRGRVTAPLEPAITTSGAHAKALLRRHRIDRAWNEVPTCGATCAPLTLLSPGEIIPLPARVHARTRGPSMRSRIVIGVGLLLLGGTGLAINASSSAAPRSTPTSDVQASNCPRIGQPITSESLRSIGLPARRLPAALARGARLTGVKCATHSDYGVVGVTFMFTPVGDVDTVIELIVSADTPEADAYMTVSLSDLQYVAKDFSSSVDYIDLGQGVRAGTFNSGQRVKSLMAELRVGDKLIGLSSAKWDPEAIEVAADD